MIIVAEGYTVSAITIKDKTFDEEVSFVPIEDLTQKMKNLKRNSENVSIHDDEGDVSSIFLVNGDTIVADVIVTLVSWKCEFELDNPKCQVTIMYLMKILESINCLIANFFHHILYQGSLQVIVH